MFGPTAAGKTNLAIKTYDYLPIEIISVDSVMVYKKCDVGSAKPDKNVLKNRNGANGSKWTGLKKLYF